MLYIGTYPLWAPLQFLVFTIKILVWLAAYGLKFFGINIRILANSASPKFGAACYALVPICYLAINDSRNEYVIYGASFLLVLLSYRIIFGVFRWAMKPLDRVGGVFTKMETVYRKKMEEEVGNIRQAAEDGESKKIKDKLKSDRTLISILEWLERNVLTQQRLLGVFFLVLAFSVFLIVANYGFAYWGLNHVSADHYNGQEEHRGLWDFTFFSAMVMTTSDLSEIVPISPEARILGASQIGCSIMLLSLIVLAFSTSGHADVSTAEKSLKQLLLNRREIYDRIKEFESAEDAEIEEIPPEAEDDVDQGDTNDNKGEKPESD